MKPDNLVQVSVSSDLAENKDVIKVDYLKSTDIFAGGRFLAECALKMDANCVTLATAQVLLHKFFKVARRENHDMFLIAAACLYVSGKLEEQSEQLKIRDIINVVHSTLHRTEEPLGLDANYYDLRQNICNAELLVLRMVGFKTAFAHPHKYLLHQLASLRDWMSPEVWSKYPVSRTSWAILQDFYHDPRVLSVVDEESVEGSQLAAACISLSLQTFGIQVPFVGDGEVKKGFAWFNAFSKDLTKEKMQDLTTMLMDNYNNDERYIKPLCISK